ncbi:MAG: thioredoxin [Bacteroidales bacterium]
MSNKKQDNKENFWQKTRPIQIAVLVIAVAIGTVMIFNSGNGNAENTFTEVSSEESMVLIVTDNNFDQTIAEGVTLVDFWAVWCPPCRIQNPIIEEVAQEIGDMAKITKLDVDNNPNAASNNGVRNIPTLIIFKDGKQVERYVGVQQKENLIAAIKSHL